MNSGATRGICIRDLLPWPCRGDKCRLAVGLLFLDTEYSLPDAYTIASIRAAAERIAVSWPKEEEPRVTSMRPPWSKRCSEGICANDKCQAIIFTCLLA